MDKWADGSEWTWVDDPSVEGDGYWKNTKPSDPVGDAPPKYAGAYWYGGSVSLSPPAKKAGSSSASLQSKALGDGTIVNFNPATGAYTDPYTGAAVNPADHMKASSGGTTIINTPIQNQAGRYTTAVDSTGAITGIPGAVYQQDSYDGSITIVTKPSSSAASGGNDADGDGFDDKTGLPNGVVSIGGKLYYQGQRVNPDGSPYNEGNEAPALVNGKYTWDATQGKYVIAPGMEGTTGSSGGGSISISTGRSSSSGSSSSGGGSTSTRDYIGEIGAKSAADLDYLDKKFALEERLALLEFALKSDPNNPSLVLQRQQLALQAKNLEVQWQQSKEEQQQALINDFRKAVQDIDPNAVRNLIYGNQVAAGGTLGNALKQGGGALSNNALVGAALLAERLRLPADNPFTGWLSSMPGLTAAVQTPGIGNAPPVQMPGLTGTAGVGTTGATGGTGTAGSSSGASPDGSSVKSAQEIAIQIATNRLSAEDAAARKAAQDYENPANWKLVPSQNLTYSGAGTGDRYVNTVTGDRINALQYAAIVNPTLPQGDSPSEQSLMMSALDDAAIRAGQIPGAALDPNAKVTFPQQTATGTRGTVLYNMPWGWSTTNQVPSTNWQTGGDRGSLEQMINVDYGTPMAAGSGPPVSEEPVNPNQVLTPGLAAYARGTQGGLARGMHIVGDPQRPGRPNPELVEWTPQGNRIIPVNDQALMRRAVPAQRMGSGRMPGLTGIPAYARGTAPTTSVLPDYLGSLGDEAGFFQPDTSPYTATGDTGDATYGWGANTTPVGGNQYMTLQTPSAPVGSLTGSGVDAPAYVPPAPAYVPPAPAPAPAPVVPADSPAAPAPVVQPEPVVSSPVATVGAGSATSPAATVPSASPSSGSVPLSSATAPAPGSPTTTTTTPTVPAPPPATDTTPVVQPTATTAPTTQLPGLTTPSGDYDMSTLTPAQTSIMEEIRDYRQTTPDLGWENNLYSVEFGAVNPYVQQQQLLNLQQQRGIPADWLGWEINKYRNMMPGLTSGGFRVGY